MLWYPEDSFNSCPLSILKAIMILFCHISSSSNFGWLNCLFFCCLFRFLVYCCENSSKTNLSPNNMLWGLTFLRFSVFPFLSFMFMGCIFLIHGDQGRGLASWYRYGKGVFLSFVSFLSSLFNLSSLYFRNKYTDANALAGIILEHGGQDQGWWVGGGVYACQFSFVSGFLFFMLFPPRWRVNGKTCKGKQLLVWGWEGGRG
ncbi:hypothetical protein L873DRAFT_1217353 [Choiromyces venosus 120613-1]|uniref:Uncharacterized protein n=1 Tax=Choiromyces venosus 120613-1 TaxID=1336337 RepID=A0A3N4JIL6_9PEZI|nr:hypothetical protein L873DRAFT_1217353 [Choiromyces venosus 120613-1]